MAGRPIIALVSLVLVAAGVLFQFFVILSGATSGSPEPNFYFLEADTSAIANAPPASAWTFFSICTYANGVTTDCRGATAALPFNPSQNFGTVQNVPAAFLGTNHYYYLSRFMFAFYIIALFFGVVALFTGLLAVCTRLGSYLSGVTTGIAVFFQALAAALMTAWTVQARNAFQAAGTAASLGKYSYGFTWGAFAAFFLSMILFCVAGAAGKDKTYSKKSRFGVFGRKRSTRSRGSFGGSATENGVKDEYA